MQKTIICSDTILYVLDAELFIINFRLSPPSFPFHWVRTREMKDKALASTSHGHYLQTCTYATCRSAKTVLKAPIKLLISLYFSLLPPYMSITGIFVTILLGTLVPFPYIVELPSRWAAVWILRTAAILFTLALRFSLSQGQYYFCCRVEYANVRHIPDSLTGNAAFIPSRKLSLMNYFCFCRNVRFLFSKVHWVSLLFLRESNALHFPAHGNVWAPLNDT